MSFLSREEIIPDRFPSEGRKVLELGRAMLA